MTADQLVLPLAVVTVHCFACPHTVDAPDPVSAHDAMEAHYRARHAALIRRLVAS